MAGFRFFVIGFIVLLGISPAWGQVKRSRAESIPGIVGSNTIGLGNIWSRSFLTFSSLSNDTLSLEPQQFLGLGLAQNMSIFAGAVPFEKGLKSIIGRSEAHLKVTLPSNDNLRFFGLALQADLLMSSEQDTSGGEVDTSTPRFTPQLGITAALDLDLIKIVKGLPIKFYANWSLFDNESLAPFYKQHSIRVGIEYKGPRNSGFVTLKYGLYKKVEKGKENAYDEKILIVIPGFRYRILQRFSILGMIKVPALVDVKEKGGIPYEKFSISGGLEFPLFFRETNAEAIRAMIFLEQREGSEKDLTADREKQTENMDAIFGPKEGEEREEWRKILIEDDGLSEREKKIREKREKIEEELQKIEDLIE